MPDLGPHAFFIISAYTVTIAVAIALLVWAFRFERRQRSIIEALERQGFTRRGRDAENAP